MPKETTFAFRVFIASGSELPAKKKLRASLTVGYTEFHSSAQRVRDGVASWEFFAEDSVTLPQDPAQWPDTFVYIATGDDESDRSCFARIPTASVMAGGFTAPARWVELTADPAVDNVSEHQYPGALLVRLGMGAPEEAAAVSWEDERRALTTTRQYTLRCQLFQARGLAASDSTGSLDPYVAFSVGRHTVRSTFERNTTSPAFWQTLSLELELPMELQYAPQAVASVFDHDDMSSDDYCGSVRVSMGNVDVFDTAEAARVSLTDPVWYDVHFRGKPAGQLLLGFQLLRKDHDDVWPAPAPIKPASDPMLIHATFLGLRGLASYMYRPISNPYLEYELSGTDLGLRRTTCSSTPSGSNPNFVRCVFVGRGG